MTNRWLLCWLYLAQASLCHAQSQPDPTGSTSIPAAAPVESAPRFGAEGSIVFSLGMSAHFDFWSASAAVDRGASAAPSIDYFMARNLALGLEATFSYRLNRGYGADYSLVQTETSLMSAAAHVGWNLTLGDRWSLFPQLAFGLHHAEQHLTLEAGNSVSIAASPSGAPSMARTGPWLSVLVPLLVQIAPHFLIGAGPSFYHDFSRAVRGSSAGAEHNTLSASLIVMGFWGGQADRTRPVRYAQATGTRFGARSTLVLTSELSLSAGFTQYSGTDATRSGISIGPAVDWFVVSNLAIGGGLIYNQSAASGYQPDGSKVRYDSRSGGVFARVSAHSPISAVLSWFPSARLTGSVKDYDEHNSSASNASLTTRVSLTLSATLLVHVASHYFIGIGPYLTQDLVQSGDRTGNLQTSLGLTTSAGGWL